MRADGARKAKGGPMAIQRRMCSMLFGAALCALAVPALAIEATAAIVKAHSPLRAEPGVDSRRVLWVGWETTLHNGERIGPLRSAPQCLPHEAREWSDLLARRAGAELQQAFDDELARAGYAPRNGSTLAALEVSAVLNEYAQDLCATGEGRWHGRFYVQVSWKVRHARSAKLLYHGTTKGAFATAGPSERAPAYALRDAFAVATRNLLADRRFVAALQPRGSVATVASR
jgi:hypothetical protein